MATSLSLQDSFFIKRLGSHTYLVNLNHEYSVNPASSSAGYIASSFLEVSRLHFSTTLARYHQPHTVAVQLSFLGPVQGDLAFFKVKDVKLGGQTSVIQVVLTQYYGGLLDAVTALDPGRIGEDIATAYMTNANIATFKGSTTDTPFELHPAPSPVNLEHLRRGSDEFWKFHGSMTSKGTEDSIDFFFEKDASPYRQQVLDQWVRFSDREPFSNTSLGIVTDLCVPKLDFQGRAVSLAAKTADPDNDSRSTPYHTTTLVLNMDIKKILSPVDFLFVRVQNKRVHNGRSDAEVTILDPDGELVASCSQILLEQKMDVAAGPVRRRFMGKI